MLPTSYHQNWGIDRSNTIVSKDLVLLQDGAEHRASRKLILPIFHHQALVKPLPGRIASYFDTIQAVATETVASWGKQGTISLETEMRKLTLSIAVRTFRQLLKFRQYANHLVCRKN